MVKKLRAIFKDNHIIIQQVIENELKIHPYAKKIDVMSGQKLGKYTMLAGIIIGIVFLRMIPDDYYYKFITSYGFRWLSFLSAFDYVFAFVVSIIIWSSLFILPHEILHLVAAGKYKNTMKLCIHIRSMGIGVSSTVWIPKMVSIVVGLTPFFFFVTFTSVLYILNRDIYLLILLIAYTLGTCSFDILQTIKIFRLPKKAYILEHYYIVLNNDYNKS